MQVSLNRFLALALLLAASLSAPTAAHAAFGLTNSGGVFTVDTGAGLVFKVNANGNITSLKYNGTELQDQTKSSGIASGFFVYGADTMSVTTSTFGTDTLMLTVNDVAPAGSTGNLIHYYIVRKGVNNIYMATYITQEPNVGELRYIARLLQSQLPNAPAPSDNTGTTGAIESSDVFGKADGTTSSKYYGRDRAIDLTTRGVTGPGVGVYMIYGSRESSSGGPFYRDIQDQTTELYNYMNSGHEQTEAIRTNVLYGPYVYAFTNGSAPAIPDMSFIAGLGLTGYVNSSGRGSVSIAGINGRDINYQYTVGFANTTAQYWTIANAADGSFTCADMKPGTYAMTIYKGEIAVYTGSVTVTASNDTPLSTIAITGDPSSAVPLWRIGDWDGSPQEFLNGDKITSMHPSDVRMSSWTPGTYVVGTSTPTTGFPCYQWKDVNGTQAVQFTLPPALVTAYTIRVGITTAYSGARPKIAVNSWSSSNPSISSQPDSRSLTVGTYRGNNAMYTFNVPASAFVAGTNTMMINPISGNGGTAFLSPGYSVDCVDMITPAPGLANDTYALIPRQAPGSVLDAQNAANGAPIDIHAYTGADSQKFLLDLQADGSYRIRTAQAGNRTLDLPYGNTANGTDLQLYDDNGLDPQRWFIIPNGDGWYRIAPKLNSYKAVEVTNAGTADGTLVDNSDYLGSTSQQWKLVPSSELYTTSVPSGTYTLTPQNAPASVLEAQNAANGAPIDIHTYTGADGQKFLLDLQTDGSYRIRTAQAGNRTLDLPNGNTANGIDLQLYDDNGLDPQRWYLIPMGSGYYKIAPKLNIDKSLDVLAAGTADGTLVDDWDYLGGTNQLWKLSTPLTVSALAFTPTTVTGGKTNSTGTLTLSAPALPGGAVISLSSSDPALTFTASTVTVPAGASTAPFTAYSHAVTTVKAVTVTATYGSVAKTARITVNPVIVTTSLRHVLWNNTSGQAAVWTVAPNNSFTSRPFGPYAGWSAKAISDGPGGVVHVLWTKTNGQASVFNISGSMGAMTSHVFGPYAGYSATAFSTGSEGTVHVLWTKTDNSIAVWTLNPSAWTFTSKGYGPYAGWTAKAISDGPGGVVHVLWTHSPDNQVSVWNISSGGVMTSHGFGPYAGYTATAFSTGSDGKVHLLWTKTDNSVSLWSLNATSGTFTSKNYGPYSGYTCQSVATSGDGNSGLLWGYTSGSVSLWQIYPDGSIYTNNEYGPYAGWTAIGLTAAP